MKHEIDLVFGMDAENNPIGLPLRKAPHILVAGMTGGGKSVFIHQLLAQLIRYQDDEVGLVLIDPKRVEFGRYSGIPHLVDKPVYDLSRIRTFLEWTVNEMNIRFNQMEQGGWRDIEDQRDASTTPWSRLVVVVDELANLILANRAMERPIVRLASMGRAAGIHLILATQRPSADVVTGLIRANVPTRVCMPVITKMDSRIVLDAPGGEQLVYPGEMLVRIPGRKSLIKLQGRDLRDEELERTIEMAKILGHDAS